MENVVNPCARSCIPHSRAVGLPSGGNAHKLDYRRDGAASSCDGLTSEMSISLLED
jgi:hypothetical protein